MGDAGLQQLSSLTSLTNLNLDSRLFTDLGMRHIQGLTNLVVLDLFAAKISDIGCGYFRSVASCWHSQRWIVRASATVENRAGARDGKPSPPPPLSVEKWSLGLQGLPVCV